MHLTHQTKYIPRYIDRSQIILMFCELWRNCTDRAGTKICEAAVLETVRTMDPVTPTELQLAAVNSSQSHFRAYIFFSYYLFIPKVFWSRISPGRRDLKNLSTIFFFYSMASMGLIYTVLPAIVMYNSFDKICTEVIWSSNVLKLYLGILQDSRRICETQSAAFGILYIEYIEGVFVRI